MIPPTFSLNPRRVRRKRKNRTSFSAPVLVAAMYDAAGPTVTLTFDQAIDVSDLDGSQVVVVDGNTNLARYEAVGGATMLGTNQVELALVQVASYADPVVMLDATASNGIEAVNGGQTWAGVTGAELPIP